MGEGPGPSPGEDQPERAPGQPVGQGRTQRGRPGRPDGTIVSCQASTAGHPVGAGVRRRGPGRGGPARAGGTEWCDGARGRRPRRRRARHVGHRGGRSRASAQRRPPAPSGCSATRTTRSWVTLGALEPVGVDGVDRRRPAGAGRSGGPAGRRPPAAPTPRCRPTTATTDGGVGARRAPRARRRSGAARRPGAARTATPRGRSASACSNASRGISQTTRVAPGAHAGRAGLAGEQRELAEHLARPQLAHDPAAHLDLEPAAAHDVRRSRRLALAHQPGAGRHRHAAARRPRAAGARRGGQGGDEGHVGEVVGDVRGRGAGRSAGRGRGPERVRRRAGVGLGLLLGLRAVRRAQGQRDECGDDEGADGEQPPVAEDVDGRWRGSGSPMITHEHGDAEHAAELAGARDHGGRGGVAAARAPPPAPRSRAGAAWRRPRCR